MTKKYEKMYKLNLNKKGAKFFDAYRKSFKHEIGLKNEVQTK